MDKLKSVFSHASNKDEESTNTGATGAGSHLSSGNAPSGLDSTTQSSNFSPSSTGPDPNAARAASSAWAAHSGVPGSFPQEDNSNPYAASHIDPRVDKTPRVDNATGGSGTPSGITGSSLGQKSGTTATDDVSGSSAGQDSGPSTSFNEFGKTSRSSGPTPGFNEHSLDQNSGATSGLTGETSQTSDLTSRFDQYGSAAGSRGLDNTTSDSSAPIKSLASDTTSEPSNQGILATAMGALGLGRGAAAAEKDKSSSGQNTTAPSTTTGVDSYSTPSQSGPTHHRKESIPTTAYPSGSLDSPRAVAPPRGDPGAGNSTAIADEPSPGDGTGVAAIGSTSTYRKDYLGSGEPTSSVIDPNSSDPTTFRKPESSHTSFYDAATAPVHQSGTSSSGVGGPTTSRGYDLEPGTSSSAFRGTDTSTSGLGGPTTDRGFLEPSTKSSGTGSTGASQGYGSTSAHPYDTTPSAVGDTTGTQGYAPTPDGHTGRDAAAAGVGAGALGAGAYEYEKQRGNQGTSTGERFDQSAPQGYSSTSDYPGGISKGYTSATPNPTASHEYSAASGYLGGTSAGYESKPADPYSQAGERHTGRDTALAGAGAGAVGAGAYEYEKHNKDQRATTTGAGTSQGYGPSAADPSTTQGHTETGDRHLGRDAAVAGVGTGAAGAGAYEYSKHDEKEHRKELEKEQKAHDKALAKDERHHEKEIAKEEKQHRNKLEKSEKQQEKAIEKEEKKHEKELAKEDKHHHGEEAAGVGAAGATGAGAYELEKHHDEHEEHSKKPSLIQRILHPNKSKQQESGATSGLSAADEADRRAYTEYGDAATRRGSTLAPGYAEAPAGGYASQVTGGTGSTALAHGAHGPSGSHATGLENTVDSRDIAGTGAPQGYATEGGQTSTGTGYEAASTKGDASQLNSGAGTTTLGSEGPTGTHHAGDLTRESMTGQQSGHNFGEITDHKR